jgi:hydroxyacylglutathione hydrolase
MNQATSPDSAPRSAWTLTPIPAFDDNYLWMLDNGREALVVDPGDAAPVLQALAQRRLELAGILVTHHHGDHVGGVVELQTQFGCPVYAPATERIPGNVQALKGGDHVELLGRRFEVIDVPGHTSGHIAYFWSGAADEAPLLFCGDTLFSGGCGRLFEGTPAQMLASLDRLAALPGRTRVCCAHEYTLSNLRFALAVEPGNAALARYEAWCQAERAAMRPTLPSSIERETQINPFLRSREAEVRSSVSQHAALGEAADAVQVFASLREWKNNFR